MNEEVAVRRDSMEDSACRVLLRFFGPRGSGPARDKTRFYG